MDGNGGAPYDPCECIFSHEGAMRRLISLVNIALFFAKTTGEEIYVVVFELCKIKIH